jgi:DNA-binding transcriptional ArsR family regulator
MKTDYIISGSTLPPHLVYPRFLLGLNIRLTAKEVYAIMLDMALNSENVQTDKRGRCYLAFFNKTIAEIIDRTPSTVAQALRELEDVGLVEKKLIALHVPYHVYVKLPIVENEP